MGLSDVLNISVALASRVVTRQGFGIPLILGYHTNFVESLRYYTTLAGMVTDGFATTDPEYRAAAKILAQNPRPVGFYVGRRDNTFTQTLDFTPTVTTTGYVYKLTVSNGVVSESATYTVQAADTVADITLAMTNAINAFTTITATATDNSTKFTVAADTAGMVFDFFVEGVQGDIALTTDNVTTATGLDTDIATVGAASTAWYCLLLTSHGGAEIELAATAVAALTTRRLLIVATQDSDVKASGSSDVATALLTNNGSARTAIMYHHRPEGEWPAAAWAGRLLPEIAGGVTWAWKTLTGVSDSDLLTDTEQTNLRGKRCNFYVDFGLDVTMEGFVSDTTVLFIDITRGMDWLQANLQADLIEALASVGKIPYTDPGIQTLRGVIMRRMELGVDNGFLVEGTVEVDVPEEADVSAADKAARRLTGVTFQAQVAGAVHGLTAAGSLYL
jgi:hypothetical protein